LSYDGDFCDVPEFYSEEFPVARKPHECCECLAPIAKGEKHLRWVMKWEGTIDSGRQHMLCRELCMFMNQEGDGCCGFGEMKNQFREEDYTARWNHDEEPYRSGRRLMAQILWRERSARVKCGEAARPEREGA
jgi:hypothetical protein